jgi:hypothetical protein
MTEVVRHRFGQPCFNCPNNVPAPRSTALREDFERRGQKWRKSDLLCVDCEKRARAADGAEVTRPTRR